MSSTFDIQQWMDELGGKLAETFGERVVLIGLQGSRARNEAREGSDIDAVVLIDDLAFDDLDRYRSIIETMPHHELACGFVGSPDMLAHWPRYDAFNLIKDTKVIRGSFDFMDTNFTEQDAMASAKAGAAEIYHALCHTDIFERQNLKPVLDGCVKSVFFVMRARHFAETGAYPASRATMKELALPTERLFLDAYDHPTAVPQDELAHELLSYVKRILGN